MPAKKYELKVSSPSPIIEFDEWYGEKNATMKGTPPRKYKAKSKSLIVKMLEKLLNGESVSGYAEMIKDFNESKNKSELEEMAEKTFKNSPEKLKTFKELSAEIKKRSKQNQEEFNSSRL